MGPTGEAGKKGPLLFHTKRWPCNPDVTFAQSCSLINSSVLCDPFSGIPAPGEPGNTLYPLCWRVLRRLFVTMTL